MEKAAEIVKTFPAVRKAVVIGPAVGESFAFDENIMLAVYTEPGADIAKTCVDLSGAFLENQVGHIDIYMMADEDFSVAAAGLIKDGEAIFTR